MTAASDTVPTYAVPALSKWDREADIVVIGAGASGLPRPSSHEFVIHLTKPGTIGCQYNYRGVKWMPGSKVFHRARATGLTVNNWQNLIIINMVGDRFYEKTEGNFTSNNYDQVRPHNYTSWLNARNISYKPNNWVNAAMAGLADGHNGGGPIWAIFDADAVARENWHPAPPDVDSDSGFFFSADTLAGLAAKIVMPRQRVAIPPAGLVETVARYNSFVDTGSDPDFGKPLPTY